MGARARRVSTPSVDGYAPSVATDRITVPATRDSVFDVLEDACAYPRWVVGAQRVRAVDPTWPAVGSRFHHSVGLGVHLHDSSNVLASDRPHRFSLETRFRPFGIARVDLDLDDAPGGGTAVTITEVPVEGPARRWYSRPLDRMVGLRNVWSLRRLRRVVVERTRAS
jgi:hypothetical protein